MKKTLWPFSKKEQVRRSGRMPRFGIAKLDGADGYMGEAYVKELSREGARLSHDDPASVPDVIRIDIPTEGVKAEAIVKWRSKRLLGVKFTAPVELKVGADKGADRLRHLGWKA